MSIRTHHITVARTARYCTLGAPGPDVRELWIACHGYGQLAADFLEGMHVLMHPTRLLVAPEALSRYYLADEGGPHGPESRVGATWMTREERLTEIDDYVAYLDKLYDTLRAELGDATPVRVLALGFSQGTATISRWAARTTARVDELVLWGGRLPPEIAKAATPERWRRLLVTFVVGSRDHWADEAALRNEEAKLRADGLTTRLLTFEGGHRLDDDTLLRVAGDARGDSSESVW